MNPLTAYLTGIALVVCLALATMVFLRRPLRALLVELCGNERRAGFWLSFFGLAVVLTTAFGVLTAMPVPSATLWRDAQGARVALEAVRSGLFGLIAVLAVLGCALLTGVRRYEERERRAALVRGPHTPREPEGEAPRA